jgi:brefeldin A-resistance guanine nucleotide exchange factor 1
MSSDAPSNGIYIVSGEVNLLLTNLKRNFKYGSNNNSTHYDYHNADPLTRNFYELKQLLNDHSGKFDHSVRLFFIIFIRRNKKNGITMMMMMIMMIMIMIY